MRLQKLHHYKALRSRIIFDHTDPNFVFILLHNHDRKSQSSGGRLNKKDGLTRYGDSHVKDKTS